MMRVGVWILLLEPACDCIYFSLRLTLAEARLEPSNHVQEVRPTLIGHRRCSRGIVGDGRPKVERFVLNRKLKAVRHHTNDRVALPVECDRLIQDRSI